MSECKHGLTSGCIYCHAPKAAPARQRAQAGAKRPSRSAALSDKMNDRMTALKKRLRELRGE